MTTKQLVQVLFIVCTVLSSFAIAQVGERCVMRSTGEQGVCKLSSDCPAIEEQAKRGISPTICGFYELVTPIVCCDANTFIAEPNENIAENSPGSIVYPEESDISPEYPRPQVSNRLRKSEEKCQEYSKPITGVIQAIALVTHTEPITINVPKCDYNGVPLIVGGEPASAGEFPYMAAIGFRGDDGNEWKCGGTLISDKHVLTAAHCIGREPPRVIRLGDLDLSRTDDGVEEADYNIHKIVVHPKYHYPQKYNDVAILFLTDQVRFGKFVRPACLYHKSTINQPTGIATGWGRTDYAGDLSSKLMKVSLNLYGARECQRIYGPQKGIPQGFNSSSMLCAGELRGGRDTCQGDSGGPLIITKKGNQCKFFIIGITSFGKSCGQENTPAVYTRVSEYVSWIEDTIW